MDILIILGAIFLIGCMIIWAIFRVFVKILNPYVPSGFPTSFWLVCGIIGANITSLGYGTWRPPVPGGLMFPGKPATIHRGWPLPWTGFFYPLEVLFIPFMLLVDIIVWTFITGYLIYLVVALVHHKQQSPVHPGVVQGAIVGGIVFAYLLPFLIPPILFLL